MKFTELKLDERVLEAISFMGFEKATPIQEQAIPIVLEGGDLIACAQTGTGKTAAFVLPLIHKLIDKEEANVDALIIVPTRELAVQIEQQIQGLAYFAPVSSIAIYGGGDGVDFQQQKRALTKGTNIVVATPGKLLSHLNLGYVKVQNLKHLILDEADRMLDMGFIEDLSSIINYLPKDRQTLMFSATMPPSIRKLAKDILTDPKEVSLAISKPAAGVDQKVYLSFDEQKVGILAHLLKNRPDYDSVIVFTSTKSKVAEIVSALKKQGFKARGISSMLVQAEREEVLRMFRARRIRVLVATDVMSRGIDIKDLNMVVNYDVPNDAEDYVHRIGRTARVDAKGEAVTFISPKEMGKFARIESLIEMSIDKLAPPEELGKGPEWRTNSSGGGGNRGRGGQGGGKRNFKSKSNQNRNRGNGRPNRGPSGEKKD